MCNQCPEGHFSCSGSGRASGQIGGRHPYVAPNRNRCASECVNVTEMCDGEADCCDGSDETNWSCYERRIARNREILDNYGR